MMPKKHGNSSTHIVYFKRNFLRLNDGDTKPRKVKVTFGGLQQPAQNVPEKFVIWQRGIGFRYNIVFKPEEFCAMDVLDQEISKPNSVCACFLGSHPSQKHYSCLYIALARSNRQIIIQLLEPKSEYHPTDLQELSLHEPAVVSLQKVIKEYIGAFEQWTVEVKNCLGGEQGSPVILAITKHCFSILRDNFVILHTHSFRDKQYICTFSPMTEVLRVQIADDTNLHNFQLSCTYEFHTHVGRIIESRINENWRTENGDANPVSPPRFTEIPVNNFQNTPEHLDSTGSANGHATIITESVQIAPVHRPPLTLSYSQQTGTNISPLPSPCRGVEPRQHAPNIASLIPEQGIYVPKKARKYLRSSSFPDLLTDEKYMDHIYVNESLESWEDHCRGRNETVYYRFYYNLGYVRSEQNASMRTKLRRRSRLSEILDNVDFEVLAKHEMWYDKNMQGKSKSRQQTEDTSERADLLKGNHGSTGNQRWGKKTAFKQRTDPCFYSTSDESEVDVPNSNDDNYWNSDLCITLQKILEHRVPKLCEILDITYDQLLGVVFTMHTAWKDLAGLLGWSFSDVNIIENFSQNCPRGACQYAMPMEILLCHWIFLNQRNRNTVLCNHEKLHQFLTELGRDDVLHILHTTNTNEHIQTEEEFQVTHL